MRRIVWAVLVWVVLWLAGFIFFVTNLPDAPIESESKTDGIVVLTGGSERLEEGLYLLKKEMAPVMFISGVGKGVKATELFSDIDFPKAEFEVLLPRIVLGHKADSTFTNASEVAEWVKENRISNVRLVTSNYHMFRSLTELRNTMPDITIIPHPVVPRAVIHSEWWRFPNTAALLFVEYNKLLVVSVRVWIQKYQ